MHRRFPSLSHSAEFGYAFDSDAYDMRAPIEQNFRMFHTYGDGLCQHSGDWSVKVEYLADYLASLAQAAASDEELLDRMKYAVCNRPQNSHIAFALTVAFNPERPRYVNMSDEKISAAPSKQYDTRWKKIEEWANGSAFAAYRLLIPDYADGMMKYSYAEAVREYCLSQREGPWSEIAAVMLKWWDGDPAQHDKALALHNAYQACYLLVESYLKRHGAKVALENYKRNANLPVEEAA